MVILKAIGAFFVKIWRWIKDTAWVQPLLIVGAIFAVIFSIPSITSWANAWSGNATNSFYNSSKKTLEGEGKTNGSSEADKLTQLIQDNRSKDATAAKPADYDLSYGTKFFLIYVNGTDSTSKANEKAFKYLSENWNTGVFLNKSTYDFKYYTIFSDDTSSNDDDTEMKSLGTAFERYLINNCPFFNQSFDQLTNAPYYKNSKSAETDYDKFTLQQLDATKTLTSQFYIPSITLVDYSQEAIDAKRQGLSEALFSVSGETDSAKAKTLINMWNHLDSATDNIFSSSYFAS
jgi:hypothetical protein